MLVGTPKFLFVAGQNFYYHERNQIQNLLLDVDGICDISLNGFEEEFGESVATTSFSLKDHPDSCPQIAGLENYESTRQFHLAQIGPWQFVVAGRRHLGAVVAATGEPVETDCIGGSIEIGGNSPYMELIPYNVTTLEGLIDNYDNLATMFASWPRDSNPGQVTLDDGTKQYFYVVRDKNFKVDQKPNTRSRDNNALDRSR